MSETIRQENGDRVKSNPLLEAALAYARLGWYVIPLHNPTADGKCSCGKDLDDPEHCSAGKHPRISRWQEVATIDPEQITKWWTQWPNANVGIVAGKSQLLCFDVDPKNGGGDSLLRLFPGDLPQTPTSETGGGGFHFLFVHPGGRVSNRTGIAPGLDIKADAGYFVASPSLHKSGNRYEWFEDRGPETPLAPVPQELLDLLKQGAGKNGNGNKPEPALTGQNSIPEGLRNDVIFKYARRLAKRGLSQQEIEVLALKKAESCEQPPGHPYTEDELKRSVQSAMNYVAGEVDPEVIELKDLMKKTLPDPKFIVQNLLPEGVTILAGDPKAGKSMLLTDAALSIALGSNIRSVLGTYECESTGVLYLSLEDSERGFKNRVSTMLGGQSVPDNFHLSFKDWPDGEAAVDKVDALLEKWPDVGLVIIDTLEIVRPKSMGRKREYSVDYEAIEPWRSLAAHRQVAIVLVTHIRKAPDEDSVKRVSGTQGLTGAADTIMVMERKRSAKYAVIEVTGRVIQETKLVVEFDHDSLTWKAQNAEEYLLSAQRKEILNLLDEGFPVEFCVRDIAQMLNKKEGNVRKLLSLMVMDKQVCRGVKGRYHGLPPRQPELWQERKQGIEDVKQRLRAIRERVHTFTNT